MNDAEFVESKRGSLLKVRKFGNVLLVGNYLFIARDNETFRIYNRTLEKPVLDTSFSSVQTAYTLAEKINQAYCEAADDDYLFLLTDPDWASRMFWVCRWSIKHGHKWVLLIERLQSLNVVTDQLFREALA